MAEFQVMVQADEAPALAEELRADLGPAAQASVRQHRTRGLALLAVVSVVVAVAGPAANMASLIETLWKWTERIRARKAKVSLKIGDKVVALDHISREDLIQLLTALKK